MMWQLFGGGPRYYQVVWYDDAAWAQRRVHHAIIIIRPMSHLD